MLRGSQGREEKRGRAYGTLDYFLGSRFALSCSGEMLDATP
jgi:hypothetical protein